MRELTVILSNFILQSFYLLIPLAHCLIIYEKLTTWICRLSSAVNVIVNLFLKCLAISKGQIKMTAIS